MSWEALSGGRPARILLFSVYVCGNFVYKFNNICTLEISFNPRALVHAPVSALTALPALTYARHY